MKKLLTFMVVLLAVPAVAMAAKTTAVTSGGAASLTYDLAGIANPMPPASIPIEWKVTMDDASVWAISATVKGPASLTISNLVGVTTLLGSSWAQFGFGDVANGDNLAAGTRWGGYEGSVDSSKNIPIGTTTAMTADINGISALGVGVYTLYIGDNVYDGDYSDTGWWTNDENLGDAVPFDSSTGLTITIMETVVPEPATMLLLAGAIPFLRRRTA